MRLVHEVTDAAFDAAFPLKIEQDEDFTFTVTYGSQVRSGLGYGDAAREFGECFFHALSCEGHIVEEPDEEEPLSQDCDQCGGPLVPLGVLGDRAHWKCRDCGAEVSDPYGVQE